MNGSALVISLLVGAVVMLLYMGIVNLRKKEVKADKFVPYYNYAEEEKFKKYEEIINKSKVPVKTTLILIVLGAIVIGVVAYIVVGVPWIAAVSSLAGFLIPNWYYKWHVSSNKKTMQKQMEQASEIIAAVIKTGSSMPEAFERAAREIKEPLKAELIKTATQIRIGVPTSQAFLEFATRVDIPEMNVTSIAIDLQDTGMAINVPALFTQLQSDIRYKIQFEKQVNAKTAEIRLAGIIVTIVPFVVIPIMRLSNPELMNPLFNTTVGLGVFGLSVFLILFGLKWMFNMAKLEDV